MQLPRPESRLSALEALTSLHTARIKEITEDAAANMRELKQDIKQLNESMLASFKTIGDTFIAFGSDLEAVKQDVAAIKATMATKDDIASIKATQEQILKLIQQKSGE